MSEAGFNNWIERIELFLNNALITDDGPTKNLLSAMRYSTLGGGKRLRALLVYAGGGICNASEQHLDYPAAAVELIHAYSLIHDDLPAMDDDDLRRGKPACHKAFDEAVAILAGDALQAQAFELISSAESGITAEKKIAMVDLLAKGSGSNGMAGGQVVDLEGVDKPMTLQQLQTMHNMKTGALIRVSLLMGVLCGDKVDDQTWSALKKFGDKIGLAFQVVDDILDETQTSDNLGKTQGADRALNKPTYVSLLGLSGAKQTAEKLYEDSLACLDSIGHNTATLKQLANFVVNRQK